MKVDWSIKIGDLLTMATIIVSVVALLISWSKDREAGGRNRPTRCGRR